MDSEDHKIPEEILRDIQNPELFRKYINEGKSLREIIGYSDEIMEEFYQAATLLLNNGRYQESQDAFLFLTTIDPYVYAYWLGLGISYHKLEDYEQAILSYECAAIIEKETPIPNFYVAGCHHLSGNREEARESLNLAKEKALKLPEYKDFLKKIYAAEERLK